MPCVSTVIPTHNRPDMLAEAIASVRAQTFTDYEIIVVSNGENAAMRQASRAVAVEHGCVFIEFEAGNLSAARNAGIERARGEWIAFLDDDDLWLPDKLERQVAEGRQAGADMVTCDWVNVYPDGREIVERVRPPEGWPFVKAISHFVWWAIPSATLIRKEVFGQIGAFDVRLPVVEDLDMWRRISWAHAIHQVDEVLIRRRCGHPSLTHRRQRRLQFYNVCHYFKMHRDTPPHLRFALGSVGLVLPRLAEVIAPDWLLGLLHRLKPRARWIAFRHWLSVRKRTLLSG